MERNCPICLSFLPEGQLTTLPCTHTICTNCITQFTHYSNKCPICSKEFLDYESPSHSKHILTQEQLAEISKQHKEFYENETFDCLTRKEVEIQLKEIRKVADEISITLFTPRTVKGSEKEKSVLQGIYEKIEETYDLVDLDEYDGVSIAKNVNEMIIEVKRLKSRYYEKWLEIEEDDNGGGGDFTMKFNVEYVDIKNKPHGNKKKKKKYK